MLVDVYKYHPSTFRPCFNVRILELFIVNTSENKVTMCECNSFSFAWEQFPSPASHFVLDDCGYDNNNSVVSITTMVI